MAQNLTQEEFENIMSGCITNGERYVVVESTPLATFSKERDVINPVMLQSQYNDGFYYRIGDICARITAITPKELIRGAILYPKKNNGTLPTNVYIDKVVDVEDRKMFYQAHIEPDVLNFFKIKQNKHLMHDIDAYYHTFYRGFKIQGNPDFINILKNQYNNTSSIQLKNASNELKSVLSINLPVIKEKIDCDTLTVVLAPRAKANQEEWYQQLRKSVSEWCVEHTNEGFEDGCNYIIRHTNTPTTHLGEEGDIYPGIIKGTCIISSEMTGKHILFIDDIYTYGVNIDEDCLQAIMDNHPASLTFYSVAKTLKKEE